MLMLGKTLQISTHQCHCWPVLTEEPTLAHNRLKERYEEHEQGSGQGCLVIQQLHRVGLELVLLRSNPLETYQQRTSYSSTETIYSRQIHDISFIKVYIG